MKLAAGFLTNFSTRSAEEFLKILLTFLRDPS